MPVANSNMKKTSQRVVQTTMTTDETYGMKSILMFRITMTDAVLSTAIAMAKFFHKQHNAMKNSIPKKYKTYEVIFRRFDVLSSVGCYLEPLFFLLHL